MVKQLFIIPLFFVNEKNYRKNRQINFCGTLLNLHLDLSFDFWDRVSKIVLISICL